MSTYNISTKKEIETYIDEEGNEKTTTKETTKKIERSNEPDYIKLYTKVWCEFNQIPNQWRLLFLELITRMSYTNSNDLKHSQIVATGGPTKEAICKTFNWKSNMYQKGLKALKETGAIKQISRGFYQINPNYAGRGEWKYNPKLERGGIEDLKATFDFKNKTIDLNIIWADDGKDNNFNEIFRNGVKENTIIKEIKKSK